MTPPPDRPARFRAACLPAFLLSLGLLLFGCEESVDPRLTIDRPFTLWGMINPRVDTQAVRVFEIQNTIRLIRPDPIDAAVRSVNLTTGEERVWQDSVVQLRDGDYRHVYWSAFHAGYGETYRLEVRRSDGAASTAMVTVPPPVTLAVLPPDSNLVREIIQPVFISGDPPSLPRVDVDYITVGIDAVTGNTLFHPITLSYDGRPVRKAGGWLLEIDLREDFRTIRAEFDSLDLPRGLIELREIELRVHVGNKEWASPVGFFDPDFLVEPGVLSNVENGFGFVAAGYVESTRFRPPGIMLERAGFSDTRAHARTVPRPAQPLNGVFRRRKRGLLRSPTHRGNRFLESVPSDYHPIPFDYEKPM